MKVLLVGLERVGKLFSMESLFKKKLTEADMTDVEVVTAEMTEFGSPGGRKLERSMNEALRDEASRLRSSNGAVAERFADSLYGLS